MQIEKIRAPQGGSGVVGMQANLEFLANIGIKLI